MPMGPSGSAHRGRATGAIADACCEDARAADGGGPCRGLPGRGNDAVHAPLRNATSSGGACADRLRTLELVAVTRHLNRMWATRESLPVGDHRWWHHLPCPTVPFSRTPGLDGGDRWVAHIGVAGHGRVGHQRRSAGLGGPGHRRAVVVTPTRGGPGRGAGRSAARSASSRSHRASSCCRRIHSASTIAAASSSRLVAHAVSVATSLTPFPGCCAPGPAR
jgi:hypothetical protein